MNLRNPSDSQHPLVVAFLAAQSAAVAATAAQWAAYDAGGLKAFGPAHEQAKLACRASLEAEQAVYDAGIAFAPYWHVTPRQMARYAKNSR